MSHLVVPEAEKLLDQEIRVLDRGFVRLVDYLGGDARIVQTARVSYGAGTKTVREDAALIDYLMRHQHTSPFEHVVLEFHCKMPIFVARQWVRHRAARLNEISARYSVMRDEFYVPAPSEVRRQARDNRQGRDPGDVPPELQARVVEVLKRDQARAYASYEEMLRDDVARELARINLPLSLYTEWYWQMDLHNLFHFLALRLDAHAQWEIRQYAEALARCARAVAPMAYESFDRHLLSGCRLSADEIAAVQALVARQPNPLSDRRRAEFEAKLGLTVGTEESTKPRPLPQPRQASIRVAGGFPSLIPREDVNQLPLREFEGAIHLVSTQHDLDSALTKLRREKVLGFDTESRPAFRRGESYPVSIVQICAADAAWIVQFRHLTHPERLAELFEDAGVLKVGVALDQDLGKLRDLFPFQPKGFLDLAPITTALGIQNNGLRGLSAIVLGLRISKSMQRSNWGRDDLSRKQLVYAATDAWAGREIYLALRARELIDENGRVAAHRPPA